MIRVTTYQLRRLVCVRVEHVPSGLAVEACRLLRGRERRGKPDGWRQLERDAVRQMEALNRAA